MSEREFETYLALLTKLLRLSPKQRAAIEDEFRAHMEERLDELTAQGRDRDDAIHAALMEFGDASALAHDLSAINHERRRRYIMRAGIGTFAACAAIIVGATYLLPTDRAGVPAPSDVTAAPQGDTATRPTPAEARAGSEPLNKQTRQRLQSSSPPLSLNNAPFGQVIDEFARSAGVNVFTDWSLIESGAGVGPDFEVTLSLEGVSGETALPLILRAVSPELAYTIQNGVVIITTRHALARGDFADARVLRTEVIDLMRIEPELGEGRWAERAAELARAINGLYGPGEHMPMGQMYGDAFAEEFIERPRSFESTSYSPTVIAMPVDGMLLVQADHAGFDAVRQMIRQFESAWDRRADLRQRLDELGKAEKIDDLSVQQKKAEAQLEEARAVLEELLTAHSENHPEVVRIRQRVEYLSRLADGITRKLDEAQVR